MELYLKKVKLYELDKIILNDPFFSKIKPFGNIEKIFGNEAILCFEMENGNRIMIDLIQFRFLEDERDFYDKCRRYIDFYIIEKLN